MCNIVSDLYADTATYNVDREKSSSGYKITHPEHYNRTKSPSPPKAMYWSQPHLTGASYVDITNSHINRETSSFSYNSIHLDHYPRMKASSLQRHPAMLHNQSYAVNPANYTNQSTIPYRELSKKCCLTKVNSSSRVFNIEEADGMLELGCWRVEKKEPKEVKTARREFGGAERGPPEPKLATFEKGYRDLAHTYKSLERLRLRAKDSESAAADASSKGGSPTIEKSITPENAQEDPWCKKIITQSRTSGQKDQEHIETPAGTVIKDYNSDSKCLLTSNKHKKALRQEYTWAIAETFKTAQHQEHIETPSGTVNENNNSHSNNNPKAYEPLESEHNTSTSNVVYRPLELDPFEPESLRSESSEPEHFEPEHNASATSSVDNEPSMPDHNVVTSSGIHKPSEPESLIEPGNGASAISVDNESPKPYRKVKLRGARRRKQERRLQEAAERKLFVEAVIIQPA